MNQEIETTARLKWVDLVELAGRYTALTSESANEYSGPCPKCRGTDRFHVRQPTGEPGRWFCRQCHEKWDDAIAFVQWMEGLAFPEARDWLIRYTGGTLEVRAERVQAERKPVAGTWKQDDWQLAARRQVEAAAFRLDSSEGGPGREYLAGRGILPETWQAWRLGYHLVKWKNPVSKKVEPLGWAIALPWLGPDGVAVKAIQYRLLQPVTITSKGGKTKEKRFHSRAGGERTLFGAHLVDPRTRRTLVLCEGELNAVSIWQAGQGLGLDVASWGPQDNIAFAARYMAALARRYDRVLVWADEPDAALNALLVVGNAVPLRSPRGLDANDLLQRGLLTDFLARWLERIGAPPPEIAHQKRVEPTDPESLYRAAMNECERLYQCGDMAAAGEIEEAATDAFVAGDMGALADVLTKAVISVDGPEQPVLIEA